MQTLEGMSKQNLTYTKEQGLLSSQFKISLNKLFYKPRYMTEVLNIYFMGNQSTEFSTFLLPLCTPFYGGIQMQFSVGTPTTPKSERASHSTLPCPVPCCLGCVLYQLLYQKILNFRGFTNQKFVVIEYGYSWPFDCCTLHSHSVSHTPSLL